MLTSVMMRVDATSSPVRMSMTTKMAAREMASWTRHSSHTVRYDS